MNGNNQELVHTIGKAHAEWCGPAVVGGDFNATPDQLAQGKAGARIGGHIVAPIAPRGTCCGAKGGRLLDYFLTTEGLTAGVMDVRVNYMTNLAPHRPVDLYLECNLSSVRVRKLVKHSPSLHKEL